MSYTLNRSERYHGLADHDAAASHRLSIRPGFTPIENGPL